MRRINRCGLHVWINRLILIGMGLLSGCGAIHATKEGTANVARAIFIKQITTLRLDFVARAQLNAANEDEPSSLVIRIYQLTNGTRFSQAGYQSLLESDRKTLGTDLLAQHEVVLHPGSAISLDVPMEKNAAFVGVVALFRQPDLEKGSWKTGIKRSALHADKPRLLILDRDAINLMPLK